MGPALRRRDVPVLGTTMHVVESGTGHDVLLLHGNPTSSHLWRHLLEQGIDGQRLVAPDLVGMGRSGKPDLDYGLVDHADHLEGLVDALGMDRFVVVGHDWGGPLAVELHRRLGSRVRALAFMETRLRALPSWDDFDEGGRALFQDLRTPGIGERMVLEENFFVDTLLRVALPDLPEADHAEYARPYPDPASRRPLLAWPRQIPVAGEPADVVSLVTEGLASLAASGIPTLLVRGGEGVVLGPDDAASYARTLPGLTVTDVGFGGHFLPEGRPEEVRAALASWLRGSASPRPRGRRSRRPGTA